jgi:hypothetical protein
MKTESGHIHWFAIDGNMLIGFVKIANATKGVDVTTAAIHFPRCFIVKPITFEKGADLH